MPQIESYTFDPSNFEDLSNMLYNISPTETPFVNGAGRGTASNKLHEWEMDALAGATFNAKVEGVTFTAAETRPVPERLSNYTQITTKDLSVSGTQEAINKVGRSSELSFQIAKQGLEARRDMERQLVGFMTTADATATIGAGSVGDSYPIRVGTTSVPRVAGSVRTWLRANTSLSAAGSPANATLAGGAANQPALDAVAVSGTARALLESDLKAVIRSCWTEGGNPSVILVDAFNKQAISAFTGGTTKYDTSEDKKLVTAIDLYISDFGDHTVVPDRFLIQPNGAGNNGSTAFVLDMNYWSIDYLRPFFPKELATTADAENRALIAEWTLCAKNPRASGCVADLIFS